MLVTIKPLNVSEALVVPDTSAERPQVVVRGVHAGVAVGLVGLSLRLPRWLGALRRGTRASWRVHVSPGACPSAPALPPGGGSPTGALGGFA